MLYDRRYWSMEKFEKTPTEYDMLINDEQAFLQKMDEHKSALIELETELHIIRNKITFIKRAVPQDIEISAFS